MSTVEGLVRLAVRGVFALEIKTARVSAVMQVGVAQAVVKMSGRMVMRATSTVAEAAVSAALRVDFVSAPRTASVSTVSQDVVRSRAAKI